jgi:hypothetical protein
MSTCIDDETLAELIEGRLDEPRAREVTAHLDSCDACRGIVADVVRSLEPKADTVGRYVILDCIGAGAMGIVYTAHDPDLGRKVALKLLRPDPSVPASRGAQSRLLREAQAMAQLSHPHVIRIYDVGVLGDEVFIAMELVEGGTLTQWLQQRRRPWREVLDVFRKAGEGLAAAHEAGLVHRDFKPDNVLVGRDGRVCVTDFGLARLTGSPALVKEDGGAAPAASPLAASMTAAGTLVGTPAYMSPEQLAGEPADSRSDVFGFCVALYEGLYGQRPFAGDSLAGLSAAIARGDIRRGPSPAKNVPGWLRRVVETGLAATPSSRPPSMRALLHAIDAAAVRARYVPAAVGVGLLGLSGLAIAALVPRGHVTAAGAAISSVTPRPTAITDLPRPASSNAEAVDVYERGLGKLRDGDWAAGDLRRATELDPTLAEAHLRFALAEFWEYPVEAREHLAAAVTERAKLGERDQLLLAAARAWMQSQPADHATYAKLIDAAAARYPLDADLAFLSADAHDEDGDRVGAIDRLRQALQIDPGFGSAYREMGDLLAYQGDTAGALAALDACGEHASGATDCVAERTLIEDGSGSHGTAVFSDHLTLRSGCIGSGSCPSA